VGQINFNQAYLGVSNLNYEETVKTLIHEVMHILALSSGLYTSFIDQNGLRYPSASLIADYKNSAGVLGK
jgi:predicted metallopeptidase